LDKEQDKNLCKWCLFRIRKEYTFDEYHILMSCPLYKEIREIHIPLYYRNNPNHDKFIALMMSDNITMIHELALYIYKSIKLYENLDSSRPVQRN
jgi:hypothetical protein